MRRPYGQNSYVESAFLVGSQQEVGGRQIYADFLGRAFMRSNASKRYRYNSGQNSHLPFAYNEPLMLQTLDENIQVYYCTVSKVNTRVRLHHNTSSSLEVALSM